MKSPTFSVDQAVASRIETICKKPIAELKSRLDVLEKRLKHLIPVGSKASKAPVVSLQARPPKGRPPQHEFCTVKECSQSHYAKGLCGKHYQQYRRDEANKKKTKTKQPTQDRKRTSRKSKK